MATLRVIESIEGHRSTQVTTYLSGTDRVELQTHTECFWDVVGDIVLSTAIEQLNGGKNEGGLCCLVPTPCLPEGRYYSPGVLRNLFRRVASCENWEYWLFRDPVHQFDYGIPTFSASDWSAALGKEIQQKMSNSTQLPSFAEYKKNFAPQAESTVTPLKGSLPSLAEYSRESATVTAISPFAEGNGAAVSYEARLKSLAFAHPVDQTIIKALDNAAVNAVFNKVVQTSIDANYGLTLATGIHVSQNTYSQIYEVVLECAQSLGIPVPYVIISDSVRGLNACTAGTDQFAFIAISSMLPMVLKREELKFVIGHECGHLALGHVVYHTATSMMGAMGGLLPLVGPIIAKTISYPLNAWSRRSDISADRAGLICCQD
ncbi:MAG: M48 family metallopeptidase, partial [Oscillospiraceae bacterium]|nr:M48 family metallopeptidase [Oscillospiraceae bacterium]